MHLDDGNAPDRPFIARAWEDHRRWVAAILLAHKPSWVDLDDLLQDVAVSVVRKLPDLRDPGAIKPWLRSVAINAALARARSGKVRERRTVSLDGAGAPAAESSSLALPADGAGAIDPGLREEAQRLLDLARELPEIYREPLLLKAVEGLSYRQIGAVLNLPETTVETRIARARRMLRDAAEARVGGTGSGAGARVPGASAEIRARS